VREARRRAAAGLLVTALVSLPAEWGQIPRARSSLTRPSAPTTTTLPTTTRAMAPHGPLPVPPSLLGTQWSSLPTNRREVALTFDCGANDAGVPAILSALEAGGATATFTMTGLFAQTYPRVAKEIARRGFDIGDHTYSEMNMTQMSPAEARSAVTKGAQVIERITGRDPRPVFRFPFGAFDDQLVRMVNGLGYGSFLWTVDTLGWEGSRPTATSTGGQTAKSARARALGSLTPGEIILMHCGSAPDGSTLDADALPAVIQAVKAHGYHFVTLHGFLKDLGSSAPVGSSTKYTPS
jgi:peptidoglycan/xylan/chitin deacetylase (PgdA/CDA1 family)